MVKQKALFCGASGYGNLGDDAYRILFSKYLSEDMELYFDSPYPNTNYIQDMDIVVIGGGGLIYDNHTAHSEYMRMYMDTAIKLGKPLYFLSCGVQLTNFKKDKFETKESIINYGVPQLKKWIPYFKIAKLITVRSEIDAEIIKACCPDANVRYFPDLVYLIEPVEYHLIEPNSVVFIPTPSGNSLPEFQKHFMEAKINNQKAYTVSFSAEDERTVEVLGQTLNSSGHFSYRVNLHPREAASILRDASKVVTNRYHGAIMARAVGKKEEDIIVVDNRYKSVVEVIPPSMDEAFKHILVFKNTLNV